MKLVFFAGSLRSDSLNKKFAREAMRLAQEAGADAEFIDLRDYPMPLYDGDIEAASGIPESVKKLGQKIAAADGLVISTPEYNGAISSPLKNTVDWLSREKPVSLSGKHVLLLGASPGALGAVRGLWHTRQPFEALGVHVYPAMQGLPQADKAFDDKGRLTDEKTLAALKKLIGQFTGHIGDK